MPEQERDLVDALASEERARRDGVSKRVHRRHDPSRNGNRLPCVVLLMEDRVRRPAVVIDRTLLRFPESTSDVPLLERPVPVTNTKPSALVSPAPSLCRIRTVANSCGMGTVLAEPSVLVGRRLP